MNQAILHQTLGFIGIRLWWVLLYPFLLVVENNLLPGRVVRVQTDYYFYEFGPQKLEARG